MSSLAPGEDESSRPLPQLSAHARMVYLLFVEKEAAESGGRKTLPVDRTTAADARIPQLQGGLASRGLCINSRARTGAGECIPVEKRDETQPRCRRRSD